MNLDRQAAIAELADRFAQTQGLESHAAMTVAEKVLNADEDIATAAIAWAENGTMPPAPEVEGHTPADLATRYTASQVFTILIALRRTPRRAAQMLKRFHT